MVPPFTAGVVRPVDSAERVAAGAGVAGVRVVDGEALGVDPVGEVDGGAGQVGGAHPVDDDLDGDQVGEFSGVQVVVDRMSVPYLTGAKIDFVDRIDAQGFTIDNPNASGSCACGDSFH